MSKLAPRHRELVLLMIGGLSRKEAAGRMGISHSTAKVYTWRARLRLRCRSVEQMMYELGRERGRKP